MRVSPAGLSLVQAWEGIEDGDPSTVLLDPYVCPAGVFTVGWGHALYTPAGVQITVPRYGRSTGAQLAHQAMIAKFGAPAISKDAAYSLLQADMAKTEAHVTAAVAADTTQSQFDAMCAFAFNVGNAAFDGSTLHHLHNGGQRQTGQSTIAQLCAFSKSHGTPHNIPEAFAAWSNGGGKWLLGLFRRRVSECMVYGGKDGKTAYATAVAFHD